MDKAEFIKICDSKLKLIRAEYSFSQEKMSVVLGISKKTLVEIEKGRSSLGWTGSAALCFIFSGSDIIIGVFGGRVSEIVTALAFEGHEHPSDTVGIWWQMVEKNERYCIQQNIVSQHYRLVDNNGNRVASSFNIEDLAELFNNI